MYSQLNLRNVINPFNKLSSFFPGIIFFLFCFLFIYMFICDAAETISEDYHAKLKSIEQQIENEERIIVAQKMGVEMFEKLEKRIQEEGRSDLANSEIQQKNRKIYEMDKEKLSLLYEELKQKKEERLQILNAYSLSNFNDLKNIDNEIQKVKKGSEKWKLLKKEALPILMATNEILSNTIKRTRTISIIGGMKEIVYDEINISEDYKKLYEKLLFIFDIQTN